MDQSTQKARFSKYRLMTPGPVPMPDNVLEALSKPIIHHRTPEFSEILGSVHTKLKKSFLTKNPVLIHTATGSGSMESAIINTLNVGDKVICINSGKFGQRWSEMATTFGFKLLEVQVPWGQSVDINAVEKLLNDNPDCKAVLCQASETSTATQHPIQELASLISKHEALFIVDAITAIGAMTLPMDEWKIDVMVSGSQKAYMLPTGISFISLSDKAWKQVETCKTPRFYFDLMNEKSAFENGDMYFSAPVTMIRALDLSLNHLIDSELEKTILRSQKLARVTRKAGEILGLKVFSANPSPAVTALELPERIDSQKVRKVMEEEFLVTVMGGQDQLKGKILRIGHLGWIQNEDLEICIEAIGRAIKVVAPEFQLSEEQILQAVDFVKTELSLKVAQ